MFGGCSVRNRIVGDCSRSCIASLRNSSSPSRSDIRSRRLVFDDAVAALLKKKYCFFRTDQGEGEREREKRERERQRVRKHPPRWQHGSRIITKCTFRKSSDFFQKCIKSLSRELFDPTPPGPTDPPNTTKLTSASVNLRFANKLNVHRDFIGIVMWGWLFFFLNKGFYVRVCGFLYSTNSFFFYPFKQFFEN